MNKPEFIFFISYNSIVLILALLAFYFIMQMDVDD